MEPIFDLELIAKKFELVNDNLTKLENLGRLSQDKFVQDSRNIDSAEHRIQTSVQALIDLTAHLIARLSLKTPRSSREIIEILKENNFISEENAKKYINLIFYRNNLVHNYNEIDINLLYQNLKNYIQDIKTFIANIQMIVEKYKPR